ncbi:uncharacterized protein LOC120282150 [Dioscorea cayenensis subsp. rotundata]|uniref:Uncharacterized protein LOC120282150 n=1 Tax=Dioscorea cayennensis subsp. rotundata TaxID=55577 RepID=A0AB40D2B7_DIOCR|nr:uncharacterized protein LOC120282150 [Dioscorea cayenensis subsp. rotundata]
MLQYGMDHVGRKIDDVGKTHTMAPLPQLAHEPNGSLKLVNGHSARSPLVFSEHLLTEEIVIAVDVDEVLGSFLPAVNKFIADRYSLNHSLADYFVYEFYKIWNCSPAEVTSKWESILYQAQSVFFRVYPCFVISML